jgi:FKBP-type peptidyl-prolyl cis-trans isomerase FklB
MKLPFFTALLIGSVGLLQAQEDKGFKDLKDRASYSVGMNYGLNLSNSWKRQSIDLDMLDVAQFLEGLRSVILTHKPALSEADMRATLKEFEPELRKMQEARRQEKGAKNKQEGEAFLQENKSKPDIKTTASGLQYKVLSEGQGEIPKATDRVTVHYRGTLIDGSEFDSSYRRGQPTSFAVNGVIKGWTEALQMMKVGSKWQLFIPSDLAYGESGQPPNIGPNSVLIFEVELIGVQPGQPPIPTAASQPVTSDIIKVPSKEELDKGAKIEIIKKEDLEKLQKEQQKAAPPKNPDKP